MIKERLLSCNHFSQWKSQVTQSMINSLQLSTTTEIRSGHKGPLHVLDVDALENRYLLTGGNDSKISLYDLHISQTSNTCPGGQAATINSIATTERSDSKGHNFAVTGVEWYPNDLGAFVSCSFDEHVLVWDTERVEIAGRFTLNSKINIATMHSKGTNCLVACGTTDAGLRLCDLRSGRGHS